MPDWGIMQRNNMILTDMHKSQSTEIVHDIHILIDLTTNK